jgi:antitoxin (DNA-binding transcriptional repressor) of toxin-antitoxin stability system
LTAKRIGIEEARLNLAEILMRARYKRESFLISKHGEPLALSFRSMRSRRCSRRQRSRQRRRSSVHSQGWFRLIRKPKVFALMI